MELHFFFFFLMEVNSCLTILPSDVFGRELGKLRRPRSAVGGVCCRGSQHPLRPRQETRAAASLTSPTPRPAACTRPPRTSREGRWLVHSDLHTRRSLKHDAEPVTYDARSRPGETPRVAFSRRRNDGVREKDVSILITSFFTSFSLPAPLTERYSSSTFSSLKAFILPS